MGKMKTAIIVASVFGLMAGTGTMFQTSLVFAGEGQKAAEKASENVPENIQRSAPSGEKSLPGGSGPGNRSDQLTKMDEVEAKKNPTDPEKLKNKKDIAAESKTQSHQSGSQKGQH